MQTTTYQIVYTRYLMKNDLVRIVQRIPEATIAVIGDVALDEFIWGTVEKVSPEAPVAIVQEEKVEKMLGCAGNVVANLRALGARVYFFSVTGNDRTAKNLQGILRQSGVNFEGVSEDDRVTARKTRILAEKQHVVRIDNESTAPISKQSANTLIARFKKVLRRIDVIVFSDYEKGVLTEYLVRAIKKICVAHGRKIIVDPKPNTAKRYAGAYLIKPNQREAYAIAKSPENLPVEKVGKRLSVLLKSNIIITRGSDGITICEGDSACYSMPAQGKRVVDVSGAGDTVNATLAVALAAGATLKEAAFLANIAAGIVVEKPGTATLTTSDLLKRIGKDSSVATLSFPQE